MDNERVLVGSGVVFYVGSAVGLCVQILNTIPISQVKTIRKARQIVKPIGLFSYYVIGIITCVFR